MKYLVLFEAFKSTKLSRTLSYIKDDNDFLNYLKRISDYYDFPFSELSDDMFEYLPFNDALKVINEIDRNPYKCDYESEWIDGEFCQEGKVKRTWGKGTRIIECPKCNGKGVLEPKVKSDLRYLKFWFNSSGNLVAKTAVDGLKHEDTSLSQDISKYNIIGKVEREDLYSSDLKTGDIVMMEIHGNNVIGYIWRTRREVMYIIQNRVAGSTPGGSSWKKFGTRGWGLSTYSSGTKTITKLEPKEGEDEDVEENKFQWEHKADILRNGLININKGYDIEKLLSDAHFAIILDMSKLKSENFKKRSSISSDRHEHKKGAVSFLKDYDIRKENINRYITQLSNKFDIGEEFRSINKIAPRLYCNKYVLYYLYTEGNDDFGDTISEIWNIIKKKDSLNDSEMEYLIGKIKDILHKSYKINMEYINNYNNNLNWVRGELKKQGKDNYITILDELEKLSNLIYDRILKYPIESIEDMEIMYGKMQSLRLILRGSRYTLRYLSSFFDYIRKSGYNNYCLRYIEDVDESMINDIIGDIVIISNIIKKM